VDVRNGFEDPKYLKSFVCNLKEAPRESFIKTNLRAGGVSLSLQQFRFAQLFQLVPPQFPPSDDTINHCFTAGKKISV
jgi:hypothetical protein